MARMAALLLAPNREDEIMTDIAQKMHEEELSFEVSDESLEIAAGRMNINESFTLGSCTGLSECPG